MVAQAVEQRTPILEARGISKRFGSVRALEGADFEVYPGEVVALIGDNGAGKSTLIKILSGALRPDSGTVLMRGQPAEFHSPRDARAAGIETVYQDLALAPDLDVAANLFLGRELKQPGLLGLLDFYNQRRPSPAASASRSPWPVPSSGARTSSSWTSRQRRSAWRNRAWCWS